MGGGLIDSTADSTVNTVGGSSLGGIAARGAYGTLNNTAAYLRAMRQLI